MPRLFHGTGRAFAVAMAGAAPVGTIDVARGGGEFGRGFYTQDSIGNAARRGYYLYGNGSAVLVLAIDDPSYHALSFWRLTLNRAQMLNAQLRGSNTHTTFTTNDDVVVGPLIHQPSIEQQKFQTANSQTLLNGPLTQRSVI